MSNAKYVLVLLGFLALVAVFLSPVFSDAGRTALLPYIVPVAVVVFVIVLWRKNTTEVEEIVEERVVGQGENSQEVLAAARPWRIAMAFFSVMLLIGIVGLLVMG